MSSLSNSTNTTLPPVIVLTDGKPFQYMENDLMKVNIWPLMFICMYAIAGFLGNIIVVYIYLFKWKKNKTRIFILCLAIVDLINCAFNIPVEIAVLWQPLTFDMHYLCKISRGLTFVCNNTGSLVFVSVAIERYLLVYYPLKSRQLTPRFAKLMCLTAFIIALCVSWPSFVFYGKFTLTIPSPVATNMFVQGTTCLISDDNLIHTKGLILIFTSVLFALLILTFIVLTVLYIAIGRKIYIATSMDFEPSRKGSSARLFGKSIVSAITGGSSSGNKRENRNSAASIKDEGFSDCTKYELSSFTTETTDMESIALTSSNRSSRYILNKHKPRCAKIKSRPTRKNTVMMRMVTIAFMLSFTPFLIILVIRYTNSKYYFTLGRNGKIVYSVFLRTYFINSMVNPFIYGFMNIRFRKLAKDMLWRIFCCCCRRRGTE